MADDTIRKEGEVLTQADVVNICQALKKHQLRLLSLRECTMEGSDLQRVLKLAGSCQSLHQLTFNVGMISLPRHVELLSACVAKNNSLTGLHLHGSSLGDDGIQLLGKSLVSHPGIISLDIGDCQLGDVAVDVLYDLLLPENNRPALVELTMSANPRISGQGWARLSMAIANCTSLRMLMLDYNSLGDYGASCILVAVAAAQNMEVLDMEGCGLSEHTAQLILHLVQNHLGGLSKIVLHGNKVKKSTVDAIKTYLRENHMDTESETTASELDVTLSSVTSQTTDDSSTRQAEKTSSVSGSTETETESDDDTSTIKGSAAEEYVKALSAKEEDQGEEKEKDDDEDSLGEELTEVPVFYA
ncbi:leucine-rich repeat-containing protein 73-like [Littorina saxatilis]|uniref:Uncharacterized protein n=1 Tax=Littorina saxatilis TaxID=31220 RepID=A0AAN9BH13_9CAEN